MNDDNKEAQKTTQMEEDSISILDLLIVFARHKKKILLVPILAGFAMALYILRLPEVFVALATLMPMPPHEVKFNAEDGTIYTVQTGSREKMAHSLAAMLRSRRLQDLVVSKQDKKTVNGGLTISVGRNDSVVTIEIEDESPEKAAQLANDHVSALYELVLTMKIDLIEKRREAQAILKQNAAPELKEGLIKSDLIFLKQEVQNAVMFHVLDVAEPSKSRVRSSLAKMVLLVVISAGITMCFVAFMIEAKERLLGDPAQAKKVEEARRNLRKF